MSLEDFQLLDIELFDNKTVRTDSLKINHQQAANLNNADQNVEFCCG